MLKYVADQIGATSEEFALYARREETRRDHTARLMMYLDTRSATVQDRRAAALLAAIQAATTSDDGAAIASSLVATFREPRSSSAGDRHDRTDRPCRPCHRPAPGRKNSY